MSGRINTTKDSIVTSTQQQERSLNGDASSEISLIVQKQAYVRPTDVLIVR